MSDSEAPTVALEFQRLSADEAIRRSSSFFETMLRRRSVRHFARATASDGFDLEVVRQCIDAAAQAPSGANKQPWTYVLVTSPETKKKIRIAAEEEEQQFYGGRAPQSWLSDLRPLGTDANKPFLETAPALIAVFAQTKGTREDEKHYYVTESVGLSVGILLAALQHAGVATLTHTPSPMAFLGTILGRPANERPFLLIPVGWPESDCQVPDIVRKKRAEYLVEC
jgi:iodotyrosine deiodinase